MDRRLEPDDGRDSRFRFAFAACALLCLIPIWSFEYLPMVDLPQHAAQVSIWLNWNDPTFDYQSRFVTNWSTPYLLGNSLTFALARVMTVESAFRVLLSLAVLAIPFVALRILRASGGSRWWVFLVFPVGFSYSFYWGFVNFVVATPIALLVMHAAARYAGSPSKRRAVEMFLLFQLLFVAHAILFGLCGLVAGAMVMLRSRGLRQSAVRLVPLVACLPLAIVWLARTREGEALAREAPEWSYGFHRLGELLTLPLGLPGSLVAAAATTALVATPLLLGARLSREAHRWAPFAFSLILFLFFPLKIFGTAFLYPRFAVFLIPTLLFALDRGAVVERPWRRLVAPALSAAWLIALMLKLLAFQREVGDFRAVVERIPEHQRILYFPVLAWSERIPYPVFLHFGTWYQVERGGIVDFSFAQFFLPRFRYRPGSEPPLPKKFEWRPLIFDWPHHGGEMFDYFLVRSTVDVGPQIFRRASRPVNLELQAGEWWLYRPVRPIAGS